MEKSTKWSAAFGITFVWFTTQFGGGFASGAQLKSYFINYGILCLFTCIGAQAICAVYNAYIAYYGRKHNTYDYRSFNKSFYGKYSPVFSFLFELVYVFVLLVVPAVAFSTGGATLSALTGIPYLACTAVVGLFIFFVAIYGTAIVRRVAVLLSVLIVAGLLVVFIPNIVTLWGSITSNISVLSAESKPAWPAIWSMIVYAAFQIASSPAIHSQHCSVLVEPKDAWFTFFLGFVVNSLMIFLSTLGLLAIIGLPEYKTTALPVLLLVNQGVGGSVLKPVISILIILGAVSTAVNMVAAGTTRVCKMIDENYDPNAKPDSKVIITTAILSIVGFSVAQFGLLPLVSKGYSILGWLAFPVIMIPYIIHFVVTKCDTKSSKA
ncbi:MAG: hypothetical protein LBQ97_08145 [Fusobacteriaceae bacterium]|jgi:uncharacterized membrane protein YkvI|nr:hypothetical protein [Fusobacteriaceae bacterium]